MEKQCAVSLEAVHTHTHTHTHTQVFLLNKNKLSTREDSILENKSLLSELKKYMLEKGSNAIFVFILDTG